MTAITTPRKIAARTAKILSATARGGGEKEGRVGGKSFKSFSRRP
jgi:hypothetical protein